jgi:iron complex outermembrane receptor protein
MTRNALMITAAIAALAISAPVHAQDEGEGESVEFIRIIGSRAPGRTAMDTPVPVDVFTREDLERTGVRETAALLQRIAPSFNESTSTISDGTDILRPAALRGLGPDQTLVLINGKRRHASALVHVNGSVSRGTAGVDLNAIPVSAISRIEVLRDGAAAQYGSDAIAGVINIVLKDAGDPNRLSASIGQMSEGDGEMLQLSGSHAFEFENGGVLAITAELHNRGATNRAGLDPRQQYASLPGGGDDPREAGFNRLNHRYGDAESENQFLFFNAEMPLGDMSRLYAFGGISRREGESGGFYRRSLDSRNIPSVYPDGFLPLINTDVEDDGLTVGIAGTMGLWDVDAS